jgi:uroporphyrinogen-III synthase
MAALVTNYGGTPVSAPALREVPIESNTQAIEFVDRLLRREFDLVILLTGVGTRALLAVVDARGVRADVIAALGSTKIAARGPKPVAVLRELGLAPWVTAPEPNTWRELLVALDAKSGDLTLRGARVAVQEYGAANTDLLEGLRDRGAAVLSVPVYRWAMPEDLGPLQNAARAIANREIDVALFTTATQVVHLLDVARQLGLEAAVRHGFTSIAVASIGPTTSEELREQGVPIDVEPSHPKMGFLVREAAERAADVLRTKRRGAALG